MIISDIPLFCKLVHTDKDKRLRWKTKKHIPTITIVQNQPRMLCITLRSKSIINFNP